VSVEADTTLADHFEVGFIDHLDLTVVVVCLLVCLFISMFFVFITVQIWLACRGHRSVSNARETSGLWK